MKNLISGWSNYKYFNCEIYKPENFFELKNFLKENPKNKKIIARGHGCSNGDQSVLTDGTVVDINNLNKIIDYDKENKKIIVECGVKLSDILSLTLKDDLFFKSIPGGLDITVSGAISNNVHGKDCFKNGYFKENVNKIDLLLANGDLVETSMHENNELYNNLFSSLGLLGIIYSVELKLIDIKSPVLKTETIVVENKNEMKKFFEESSEESDYLIAWLDCAAKDSKCLRGICRKAKFLEAEEISNYERKVYKKKINLQLEKRVSNNLRKNIFNLLWFIIGNTLGSKFFYLFNFLAFNFFKILGKRKKNILINEFTLIHEKYLPEYNNIFKSKGFVTIQPFFDNNNPFDKIESVVRLCQSFKILPIWCPIKKYKKTNKNFFQFGDDGYSIVIEFSPHEIGIEKSKKFLSELENLIIEQNGKVYLAKDQIISNKAAKKMYPEYKDFLKIKKKYDNQNLLCSEQFTRLFS